MHTRLSSSVCLSRKCYYTTLINAAARSSPYYTPAQEPSAGTARQPGPDTKYVFEPLPLRGMIMQNRIMVSPMCQYSSQDGHLTDWHLVHLGSLLARGPGLTMIEATAIDPCGRTTPQDAGLWRDSQIEPVRRIVDFAHSQGQNIGVQLAHAGRKASMVAPWLAFPPATSPSAAGGWPENVVGPSSIPWSERHPQVHAMTESDIANCRAQFCAAARRAVQAGVDCLEVHAAHGYLLHSFCSPVSNTRTDRYGGSFENRTRLTRDIISDLRGLMPRSMPLFVRLSGSDGLEATRWADMSWTAADTLQLVPHLAELGVDLVDVSYGGTHVEQRVLRGEANQASFALSLKAAVGSGIAIATVGNVTTSGTAQQQLEQGLDIVAVGRQFLKEPNLVAKWADELGVEISQAHQLSWMLPPPQAKTTLRPGTA